MGLRNMLKTCLVFWKFEPRYTFKRYAYKRKNMYTRKGGDSDGLKLEPSSTLSDPVCIDDFLPLMQEMDGPCC